MLKKTLMGFAAMAMCCSLASAAEGDLKVSGGLDIGVIEELVVDVDGTEMIDTSTLSFIPNVTVSKQFTEELSVSVGFSAVIGLEDDSADVVDGAAEFDASVLELKFGGLCSYTFKINEEFSVTPVAGLSWKSYDLESNDPDSSFKMEFNTSLLVLDFGAKADFKLNDDFTLTGQLMLGLPVVGSGELKVMGTTEDGDLDGGFFYEIGGGVEYKLQDNLLLYAGLAYRVEDVDWDFDDWDAEAETEVTRLSLRLGATFTF
jgi:long-subunit fatty acid transport protein